MRNLSLVFLATILFSNCEGDYFIEYEWLGMRVHHGDNSTRYPTISLEDSLYATNYVLILELNTIELSRKGRYADPETSPRNMNPLDSLSITSAYDFDETHPAGTNLSDLFFILNDNYFYTLPADGSKGYYITAIYAEDFEKEPVPSEIDLLLAASPTLSQFQRFKVEMILSNGVTYTDSTSTIKLK